MQETQLHWQKGTPFFYILGHDYHGEMNISTSKLFMDIVTPPH